MSDRHHLPVRAKTNGRTGMHHDLPMQIDKPYGFMWEADREAAMHDIRRTVEAADKGYVGQPSRGGADLSLRPGSGSFRRGRVVPA